MFEGIGKGGYAGDYINQNVYAYVKRQSRDLQWGSDILSTVHLLTGNFEELYDICCPRRKSGRPKNITRSYVKQIDTLFNSSLDDIVHVFLMKYILHVSMENLLQITHFLDNKDCIILIGEFVGLKKEWIITDKVKLYRDQAYEIAHLLHCKDCYKASGHTKVSREVFEKISQMATEFFPGRTSVIDSAINIGQKWIQELKVKRKVDRDVSTKRWEEIIISYEADRKLLCKHEIQPLLSNAVEKINILAGWDAFGRNIHLDLTTVFVTDVLTACHAEYSLADIFYHQYSDFMPDDLESGYKSDEELFDSYDTENLDEVLLICIAIEHKLSQCHFHKNKGKDEVTQILNQLPGGSETYTSDPPQDSATPDFDIYELIYEKSDTGVVTKWPLDVVQLVAALFKQGLATKDNLNILFSRSGYVSYLIWILQEERAKQTRPRIDSFFARCRIWKEGCIDNDKRLGIKIKYLNKEDRAEQFDELRKVSPIGNIIRFLEPSIEHFVVRFGLSCLNNNEYLEKFVHDVSHARGSPAISKRRRCDLDSFLTVEDACRHYFDAQSLEEAFWDHVGVPRITILNGDNDKLTMKKTGWKNCKNKDLGDKSVKLGSRVAYVYAEDCCTIWEEQTIKLK